MTVLGRFEVLPLHAQIEIRDAATAEYPQWETGEEAVVATAQCIAVATRDDADGLVTIEVRRDQNQDIADDQWRLVYEGELLLTGENVVVGSYLAAQEHTRALGRGWHQVRVLVKPKDAQPSYVLVVFDGETP